MVKRKHQPDTDASRADLANARPFYANSRFGMSGQAMTRELREVNTEIRKRSNNNLTTEDQSWARRNLRDARARLN